MADKLKVRAVEGRLCPHESTRSFVGYRAAAEGEDVDHVIPASAVDSRGVVIDRSHKFTRTADVVEVQNTIYYRRAIAVGDLEQVTEAAPRNALTTSTKKGN